jgi:hypothetical protein
VDQVIPALNEKLRQDRHLPEIIEALRSSAAIIDYGQPTARAPTAAERSHVTPKGHFVVLLRDRGQLIPHALYRIRHADGVLERVASWPASNKQPDYIDPAVLEASYTYNYGTRMFSEARALTPRTVGVRLPPAKPRRVMKKQ